MIVKTGNTIGKEVIGIGLTLIFLYTISNYSSPFLIALFHLQKADALVLLINKILLWVGLFLLFLYTRNSLKKKLLPWEEEKRSLFFYFFSVVSMLTILFAGLVLIAMLLNALQFNAVSNKQVERTLIFENHLLLLLFSALTAGVLEELLFRGYIQPRVEDWTQSRWYSILIISLLFGFMHVSYGTLQQILIPVFFSIIFSVFYATYRNLKVVILVHFLWYLISMLDAVYNM